ncbi:MAG: ribosomal protein L7/L12 [Xenococcaceae cyanobacterium]
MRKVTRLYFREARKIIEAAPTLAMKANLKEAEQIKKRLNEVGAKVSLKK